MDNKQVVTVCSTKLKHSQSVVVDIAPEINIS